MDWEWYGHPDMLTLWVHLLLSANHDDGQWRGVQIKRGQLVTSRNVLARKTGLSERTVRTCLRRLQTTNEVTIEATNKNTIITICNFDSYQSFAPTNDQQSDQQTVQQLPTNNNIRIEEDNNISHSLARARLENDTIFNSLWLDNTSMALHSSDVMQIAADIMNEWELMGLPDSEWCKEKLYRYIRKEINHRKQQSRPSKQDEKNEWRAKMLKSIKNDLNYDHTTKQ